MYHIIVMTNYKKFIKLLQLVFKGQWNEIIAKLLRRRIIYTWKFTSKHKKYESGNKKLRVIYVIGLQGGGLSFITRIMKRHPLVYNAIWDNKAWMSYDEIAGIYGDLLPKEFSNFNFESSLENLPEPYKGLYTDKYGADSTWVYASDELLPMFRELNNNINENILKQYKRFLYHLKNKNSKSENSYLLDKSQVNSLKIPLIQRVLKNDSCFFILMARNPYVMVWRAVNKLELPMNKILPEEERYKIACQHYNNTFNIALNDLRKYEIPYLLVKYEDIVSYPEVTFSEIEKLLSLNEGAFMAFKPQKYDKIPVGAVDTYKWWGFSNNNFRYLDKIKNNQYDIINRYIDRNLLDELGYKIV